MNPQWMTVEKGICVAILHPGIVLHLKPEVLERQEPVLPNCWNSCFLPSVGEGRDLWPGWSAVWSSSKVVFQLSTWWPELLAAYQCLVGDSFQLMKAKGCSSPSNTWKRFSFPRVGMHQEGEFWVSQVREEKLATNQWYYPATPRKVHTWIWC